MSHTKLNITHEAEFWRLYLQELNDKQIAEQLEVYPHTIARWRTRNHLESWYNIRKHQRMLDVARLWFEDLTYTKIAKKLNINEGTVVCIARKMHLPSRGRGWARVNHLRAEERKKRLLGLRQKGFTYDQIVEKTNLPLRRVQEIIGFALMDECRQTKTCPYKALLPEYTTEASS